MPSVKRKDMSKEFVKVEKLKETKRKQKTKQIKQNRRTKQVEDPNQIVQDHQEAGGKGPQHQNMVPEMVPEITQTTETGMNPVQFSSF